MIVAIVAAMVTWAGCLCLIWAIAADTSGLASMLTVVSILAAVAISAGVPGRAARAIQRLLWWLHVEDPATSELETVGVEREGPRVRRAAMRLVAMTALLAVVGGLLTSGAVVLTQRWAWWLAGEFLWTPGVWRAVKVALQIAGSIPLAVGAALVFLAASVARGRQGPDAYAPAAQDLIYGAAVGLACLAGGLAVRANLLGVTLVAPVAMVGISMLILARNPEAEPAWLPRPVEVPHLSQRWAIVAGPAMLALVLSLQWRLIADTTELTMEYRLAWIAGSLGFLGWRLEKVDSRSRPPSRRRNLGAVIGVVCVAFLQVIAALAAVSSDRAPWAPLVLAGVAQLPMMAMFASVLSRARRIFAASGGRARSYLAHTSAGLAAGLAFFALAASARLGGAVMLAVGLGTLAGAIIVAIARNSDSSEQLRWAGSGTVVLCGLTAMLLTTISMARKKHPQTSVRSWLTYPEIVGGKGARRGQTASVNRAEFEIRRGKPGRWWVVGERSNAGQGSPAREVDRSYLDPEAGLAGATSLHGELVARAGYDGILLQGMRLDHPLAWRVYNLRVLVACRERLAPGGIVAIRSQAGPEGQAALVAAAKTLLEALGSGYAIIDHKRPYVDVILLGPASAAPMPDGLDNLQVVPLKRFAADFPDIRVVRTFQPGAMRASTPDAGDLQRWLEGLRAPGDEDPLAIP